MTFWEFWDEHWFLAFWAIWLSAGVVIAVAKYVTILLRGWPNDGI